MTSLAEALIEDETPNTALVMANLATDTARNKDVPDPAGCGVKRWRRAPPTQAATPRNTCPQHSGRKARDRCTAANRIDSQLSPIEPAGPDPRPRPTSTVGRWEPIEATHPEASLQGLDIELRSMSHRLANFAAEYYHLAELGGRQADDVVKARAEELV